MCGRRPPPTIRHATTHGGRDNHPLRDGGRILARRRADPPPHRCTLDAADEAGSHARDRAGRLAEVETLAELREGVAELETREVRAETDVLAHAEADVRVRVAV